MLYAIVDIETTGGHASGNGITEIAIVIHDGERILDFYETLVNPGQPIPRFIQALTGISDEMVTHAPAFEEVAGQVYDLLHDKVFVAHNVNFDYSFLRHQLQQCGFSLDCRKLCTVRLSRKITPGLYSYSLGKLCRQLGIDHAHRHRAGGDAMATAHLFSHLVQHDRENLIASMLKGRNREQYLPPNLPAEQLDALPRTPGVYYFYNASGRVIYIGKANNLLKRVKTHFSNNRTGRQKQDFLREIHRISYTECATELMAHILESTEIRKRWPVHNRSQKGYIPKFGLYLYEDSMGYKRLAIERNKHVLKPVYTFNTIMEGHSQLRKLVNQFGLCARLCHLVRHADCSQGDFESCRNGCASAAGIEVYNRKVQEAVLWIEKHLPTFALIDKGRTNEEQSCILISRGNVFGMGYIHPDFRIDSLERLEQQLEPLQDNDYIRNMVYKHAALFPQKKVLIGQ